MLEKKATTLWECHEQSRQTMCHVVLCLSHVWLPVTPWTVPARLLCPWDSPGTNAGVGCHALLHWIFLAEGLNPSLLHLLHWQANSLPLSHLGSLRWSPNPLLYSIGEVPNILATDRFHRRQFSYKGWEAGMVLVLPTTHLQLCGQAPNRPVGDPWSRGR